MQVKSDRLRKLESELGDLEQWLQLGLVPKKDLEKHVHEIGLIKHRIDEEKERLQMLKENGDQEEFTLPKRAPGARPAYQETHTISGEISSDDDTYSAGGLDLETESFDAETSSGDETSDGDTKAKDSDDDDEEDPFSDKNRWKRGILEDPDGDNW
ncbi:MAG: hypothetical protein P0S94_03915 [Simkaniaceae bacterium]|nr:hypothetical protein [Simkaniaceae bacterium]